jgi:DNA-binding GntR family transcriptional regulator
MPVTDVAHARRGATTPDLIAERIRADILSGLLAPGQPLRQEDLASRFGVSRLPVRDALVRLEARGLVEVFPNRGAFVVSLSADEVREIYHLRVLLEGDMLELSVPRMTPDDWRRIDAAHEAAIRSADGPAWVDGDWDFHRALYLPAERPRQLTMIETLRGTVARYWSAYSALPARTAEWLADHDAILQACRARASVAARRRLEDHLRRASELVLAGMDSGE